MEDTKQKYKIKKSGLIILGVTLIVLGAVITGITTLVLKQKSNDIKDENISQIAIENDVITILDGEKLIEFNFDTFGRELPNTKAEGYLPIKAVISVDNEEVEVFGEIRVQGTSTERWPKKNWTLKFYSDELMENELKMKIGDSIPSNKWIAKADWIDPNMIRNGVSYNLWGQIMKTREGTNKYEVDNGLKKENDEIIKTGATGYPNYHVGVIKMDGTHYGITTLILGHDVDNFNVDKKNEKHLFLEFDARGRYDFEGMNKVDGWQKFNLNHLGHHIDSYYPDNDEYSDAQKKAINTFSDFINSDFEIFKESYSKHFDKSNMIDMLLYLEFLYDWDGVAQDVQMVTYNLNKWYILPWDKDTSFGLNYDATGTFNGSSTDLVLDYENESTYNRPWYRTYKLFTKDVEARYKDLRDKDIFSVNNIKKLADNIINKIPEQIWYEEYLRWEEFDRPKSDGIDKNQMISWTEKRLEMLDKHFNYK